MSVISVVLISGAACAWMSQQRSASDFLSGLHWRAASADNGGISLANAFVRSEDRGNTVRGEFVLPIGKLEDERRIRMSVVIEVEDEDAKLELSQHAGQLRDAFISRVVDCNAEQLNGQAGLTRGRRLMRAAVHDTAPALNVRSIYFSEFVLE
jgi:hypothetical protein